MACTNTAGGHGMYQYCRGGGGGHYRGHRTSCIPVLWGCRADGGVHVHVVLIGVHGYCGWQYSSLSGLVEACFVVPCDP